MSMLKQKPIRRFDDQTKQVMKDDADINKLVYRHIKNDTLHTIEKSQGMYGDFSNIDFEATARTLSEGRALFEELPSEVQSEFGYSPTRFFQFVNDPQNDGRLFDLLPALAAPGNQGMTYHQLKDHHESRREAAAVSSAQPQSDDTAPEAP